MDDETMRPADVKAPADSAVTASAWLGGLIGDLRRGWQERRLARRVSRASLRVYREIAATEPGLSALERYRAVVARQTALDALGVEQVLERAASSFANWPVDRPLCLRDVVQYLVVQQCLAAHPDALGVRTALAAIIAAEIPQGL